MEESNKVSKISILKDIRPGLVILVLLMGVFVAIHAFIFAIDAHAEGNVRSITAETVVLDNDKHMVCAYTDTEYIAKLYVRIIDNSKVIIGLPSPIGIYRYFKVNECHEEAKLDTSDRYKL